MGASIHHRKVGDNNFFYSPNQFQLAFWVKIILVTFLLTWCHAINFKSRILWIISKIAVRTTILLPVRPSQIFAYYLFQYSEDKDTNGCLHFVCPVTALWSISCHIVICFIKNWRMKLPFVLLILLNIRSMRWCKSPIPQWTS